MTSVSGTLFGDLTAPDTIGETFELIHQATPEGRRVWMWRGQADLSWPIHSSAYRRLALEAKEVDEAQVVRYEKYLLTHATHQGYRYVNGRRLEDFELLARLQHHGAATRLIDATRSALIALWFCVSGHPEKHGALIGIHSHFLGGYESEVEDRDYTTIVNEIKKRDIPSTWEPPGVSPRIAAQHSQFLFSKVKPTTRGSICFPKKDHGTIVIPIKPALKFELKGILSEIYDIRRKTIFPDIDGFSTSNSHMVPRSEMFRW